MGARLSSAQKDLLAGRLAGVVLLLDGEPNGPHRHAADRRRSGARVLGNGGEVASGDATGSDVYCGHPPRPDQGRKEARNRRKSTDMISAAPRHWGKSSTKQLRRDAYTKSLTNPSAPWRKRRGLKHRRLGKQCHPPSRPPPLAGALPGSMVAVDHCSGSRDQGVACGRGRLPHVGANHFSVQHFSGHPITFRALPTSSYFGVLPK
jgi:hypothetical protein